MRGQGVGPLPQLSAVGGYVHALVVINNDLHISAPTGNSGDIQRAGERLLDEWERRLIRQLKRGSGSVYRQPG